MKLENKIGLAGNGWGFIAALNSLARTFKEIEILNEVDEVELKKLPYAEKLRFVDNLNSFIASCIICAGLKDIVSADLLSKKIVINIHYSILPAYRGLHSTVWAILNNEAELGYTVHLMNEYIDDGAIIYQHKAKNEPQLTATDYMSSFNQHVQENLIQVITDFLTGKIKPKEQDKQKASWVAKRNLSDCEINFHQTCTDIQNFYRALVPPYPIPFTKFKGNVVYPKLKKVTKSAVKSHIGRIVNIDDEGIWVTLTDGYAVFSEITNQDGKIIPTHFFKPGQWMK